MNSFDWKKWKRWLLKNLKHTRPKEKDSDPEEWKMDWLGAIE